MDFDTKAFSIILVIVQMTLIFQHFFFQCHIYALFEWKNSSQCFLWNHKNETFHMELKWCNQLMFNIWLNISSSFAFIWIIFRICLHFVLYWYMYQFFTNIFFNQLKSIKKHSFFWQLHYLTIEVFYFEYNLWIFFLILTCWKLKVAQFWKKYLW